MLKTASNMKLHTVLGVTIACAALLTGVAPLAHAATDRTSNIPVTITSLCTETDGAPKWRIGNPNPNAISLTWEDADEAGVTLPYGFTTVSTDLDNDDNAAAVTFHQQGQPDVTVPVADTTCKEPIKDCVDGYTRANLTYTWSTSGKVMLATKDGKPLCDDVTVYLAAYTLPKTYDQSGVFDDSAVPQQLFSSTSAVLRQGTDGSVMLTTTIPDACTDYQLDAYYAPEITAVSYQGQGAQLIYGEIAMRTQTNCAGGHGGGQVLATSTTTPTLADTGDNTVLPALSAVAIMAAAVLVKFPVISRARKLFAK